MKDPLRLMMSAASLAAAVGCAAGGTPSPGAPAPCEGSASCSAEPPAPPPLASAPASAPAAASASAPEAQVPPPPGPGDGPIDEASARLREGLSRALTTLRLGAHEGKKDAPACKTAVDDVKRLWPAYRPRQDDDASIAGASKGLYLLGAQCLGGAGDCAAAWKLFSDDYPREALGNVKDAKQRETLLRSTFASVVASCKEKAP